MSTETPRDACRGHSSHRRSGGRAADRGRQRPPRRLRLEAPHGRGRRRRPDWIEPFADDGARLPEVHFRAVVVPGERVPLVLERPAELGLSWDDEGGDLIAPIASGIRMWPPETHCFDMTAADARELAAHLAAMADEWEAAQADQERGR